ncbi:MAG: TIGR01777 family oxidoreductase [Acidobacteriota bacterium]
MRIVVTGGTGFIGRALCASLAADGHEVVVLSRFAGGTYLNVRHVRAQVIQNRFEAQGVSEIDGADAVINLAGAGIADARWTPARKTLLRQSRLSVTHALATAIREAVKPPAVVISGSAIGFYGSDMNATFDESSPAGSDFLAELCANWEQAAQEAASSQTRVVLLRTGLVLARDGGLLSKLKPPFQFFVGGPTGTGRHWMSWIHRDDWISLVRWALTTSSVQGPLNAVAPHAVTNADFSKAFGRALHRPSLFPLPAFVLRLMFGELADGALLASQKVTPQVAVAGGFRFTYADLDSALKASV